MSEQLFTIFGATGFVGSHLSRRLEVHGHQVRAVGRSGWPPHGANLGHVIYAIGVTADFRSRPIDTVEAHVCRLVEVLRSYSFESFLYLSSTRLYRDASSTQEAAMIAVPPGDPERLYDATKVAGEALCLTLPFPTLKVARLSNLYGPRNHTDNFLSQVLAEGRKTGSIVIRTGPDSTKDYLHVEDACAALIEIATKGRQRIYNVASGFNVTHRELAELLGQHAGIKASFSANEADVIWPRIDMTRFATEFSWSPRQLKDAFAELTKLQ